jgi:hypothetical protein
MADMTANTAKTICRGRLDFIYVIFARKAKQFKREIAQPAKTGYLDGE